MRTPSIEGPTVSASGFPATPMSFVPLSTSTRTRVYLISHERSLAAPPHMTQVLTLNGNPEAADQVIAALNAAAWTGDRRDLDVVLEGLPAPIAQACEQALEKCPDPSALALGLNDIPLTVVSEASFGEYSSDLALHLESAMNLSLQVLVKNSIDENGFVSFDVTVLSGDREVEPGDIGSWWETEESAEVTARLHPSPVDLADAFRDDRWQTCEARAYWLWIIERDESDDDPDSYSATAEWVVEFLDVELCPLANFRIFVKNDDPEVEDAGVLTVRTRFLLWNALSDISVDLDSLTNDWSEWESSVKEDMPLMVQSQPREWWREMSRSAERLCTAARVGRWDELVPRTPAEEALISLATRTEYVEAARERINTTGLAGQYESLPDSGEDEIWDEILGALTGDGDIEIVWSAESFDRTDPDDEVNRYLGMGDYRPEAWHRLFERAVPQTLPPT